MPDIRLLEMELSSTKYKVECLEKELEYWKIKFGIIKPKAEKEAKKK